jgi:two-component system chemotaxis sensor kinase CheA
VKKTSKKERSGEFMAEAEEALQTLGKGLLELESAHRLGSIDPALVNGIFRSAHTLKGICGVYDYGDMIRLSHAMEDALDAVRMGRVDLDDAFLGDILHAHGLLERMAASGGEGDFKDELKDARVFLRRGWEKKRRRKEDHVDHKLVDQLTEYEEHRLVENIKSGKGILRLRTRFPLASFDKAYETLLELVKSRGEVIATLPAGENNHAGSVAIELLVGTMMDAGRLSRELAEGGAKDVELSSAGGDFKAALGLVYPKDAPVARPVLSAHDTDDSPRSTTNTVRVDIAKLDNVMNIVGELSLLKASISKLSHEFRGEHPYSAHGIELSRIEKHLDRKFSELRDSLLDVRMVPIGQLFGRYETLLSRLARMTGKEIRMKTFGAETEIDKLMVEELSDPIMHIIRNVVDHAIEPPSERELAGKERTGNVSLGAFQRGNRVVVEISDDGRGIDEKLIRERAVKKGLVTAEFAGALTGQEALELLFLPGFTTKDVVSEVSGRGVGLDVVKQNIAKLSGVIEIETEKGKGTILRLTMPITLAIVQAIIVEDSSERYALPLNAVAEVVTVSSSDVSRDGGKTFVAMGDRSIPCVRLSHFMGKPHDGRPAALHGIITGIAEHRLCIAVERIVEQLDVVIKPISSAIRVPGIAGATDLGMGDAGTILVLDASGIIEAVFREKMAGRPDLKPDAPAGGEAYSGNLH